MLTELLPELAITARFNAGSIAMPTGDAPTGKVELTPVEISLGRGSTVRFTADIAGFGAITSVFCTNSGYCPGAGAHVLGMVTPNCWLLVRVVATRVPCVVPLQLTQVLGEKNPPIRFTPAVPPFGTTVSGVNATTAGRDGITVSPSVGPVRTFDKSPFCACTTMDTDPATESGLAGIVARSSVGLRNSVGTGAGGVPTIATLLEVKFVPVRNTSCCAEPSPTMFGRAELSAGAAEVMTVIVAVPDSAGSAADTAVIVTLPGGSLTGAVYVAVSPFPAPGTMNPSVTSPPAIPFASQVTAVFVVLVTFAVKVKESPGAMVALVGEMATRMVESRCTTLMPNIFVLTVLVATTRKSLVGERTAGAV